MNLRSVAVLRRLADWETRRRARALSKTLRYFWTHLIDSSKTERCTQWNGLQMYRPPSIWDKCLINWQIRFDTSLPAALSHVNESKSWQITTYCSKRGTSTSTEPESPLTWLGSNLSQPKESMDIALDYRTHPAAWTWSPLATVPRLRRAQALAIHCTSI